MSNEIEKRWILPCNEVKINEFIDKDSIKYLNKFESGYCNTYFFHPENSQIFTRLRKCVKNEIEYYSLCTKIGQGEIRSEYESGISKSDFDKSIHGLMPVYFDFLKFESKNHLRIEIKLIIGFDLNFIIEVEYPYVGFSENNELIDLIHYLEKVYKIKFNSKLDFNLIQDVTNNPNYELINIYKYIYKIENQSSLIWVKPKFNDELTLPEVDSYVLCYCIDHHNNSFYAYLKSPLVDGYRGFYWTDKDDNIICDDGCNCIRWLKIKE